MQYDNSKKCFPTEKKSYNIIWTNFDHSEFSVTKKPWWLQLSLFYCFEPLISQWLNNYRQKNCEKWVRMCCCTNTVKCNSNIYNISLWPKAATVVHVLQPLSHGNYKATNLHGTVKMLCTVLGFAWLINIYFGIGCGNWPKSLDQNQN